MANMHSKTIGQDVANVREIYYLSDHFETVARCNQATCPILEIGEGLITPQFVRRARAY